MTKIPYSKFIEMWDDLDLPDTVLAEFVVFDESENAFAPNVQPDPDKVDMPRLESALGVLNSRARRRRQRDFRRAMDKGDRRPVLVTEGDSWFQFPLLLKDVVDHLSEDYLVWSLGAAADTVKNMIDSDAAEYMEGLQQQADHVQAFLLSAAGNDVIGYRDGEPVLLSLLHNGTRSNQPEKLVNQAALQRVTEGLRDSYLKVVRNVRSDPRFETLPILIHGYDYTFPYPYGRDPRPRRLWTLANPDKWLGTAFEQKGIMDPKLRRDIVKILIDALYEVLADVAAGDEHMHLIDVRGTLTQVRDWADEIHGTDAGFARVASKFNAVLQTLVTPSRQHETLASSCGLSDDCGPKAGVDLELQAPPLLALRGDVNIDPLDNAQVGIPSPEGFAKGFAHSKNFEAILDQDNSVPFHFLAEGHRAGQAVGRVLAQGVDWEGRRGRWKGTGFLIAPNILLTNAHVVNSNSVAAKSLVEFGFEDAANGAPPPAARYRLNPSRLFVSSEVNDLDYTFVWVDGIPEGALPTIQFWRGSFMGRERDTAQIIHHPQGDPKRVSLRDNEILSGVGINEALVHYTSDTESGSSGAPVADDDWRLFALHHANTGVTPELRNELRKRGFSEEVDVVNEGIKTSAIAIDLELKARQSAASQSAREVLRHVGGTDSRTGFFGALGRKPEGRTGLERVVNTYRGAATDMDIAFWNIEWFNTRYEEKMTDVIQVIADLNLDIWALEEVSPETTDALVRALNSTFQMQFDYAVSEPDAASGKQSTAVIWNTLTVTGARLDWPAEADRTLRLDSRDPSAARFEAVEGKLFNRYPGLFKFTAKGKDQTADFDFFLVPLHLKARAEGAKRRKMASNALATAIGIAMETYGEADVVLGGDMNAELSSGAFKGLVDAGFAALSAADEKDGAFTYLKHPHLSLIDSIFISPSLAPKVGDDDFMIIAADRTMPDFVKRVSDHLPVMVRLTLDGAPLPASTAPRPMIADPQPVAAGDALSDEMAAWFRSAPEAFIRLLAAAGKTGS